MPLIKNPRLRRKLLSMAGITLFAKLTKENDIPSLSQVGTNNATEIESTGFTNQKPKSANIKKMPTDISDIHRFTTNLLKKGQSPKPIILAIIEPELHRLIYDNNKSTGFSKPPKEGTPKQVLWELFCRIARHIFERLPTIPHFIPNFAPFDKENILTIINKTKITAEHATEQNQDDILDSMELCLLLSKILPHCSHEFAILFISLHERFQPDLFKRTSTAFDNSPFNEEPAATNVPFTLLILLHHANTQAFPEPFIKNILLHMNDEQIADMLTLFIINRHILHQFKKSSLAAIMCNHVSAERLFSISTICKTKFGLDSYQLMKTFFTSQRFEDNPTHFMDEWNPHIRRDDMLSIFHFLQENDDNIGEWFGKTFTFSPEELCILLLGWSQPIWTSGRTDKNVHEAGVLISFTNISKDFLDGIMEAETKNGKTRNPNQPETLLPEIKTLLNARMEFCTISKKHETYTEAQIKRTSL